MQNDEAATTVASRGPCEDCGGWETLVTYLDGHAFCYGCNALKKKGGSPMEAEETHTIKEPSSAERFTTAYMPDGLAKRKLTTSTLSKFGYFVNEERLHVAPYYDPNGQLAYQKYRTKDKDFFFTQVCEGKAPRTHEVQLFGQQVWGDKYDKKVVITEGEIDAMSVAQALSFKSAAVVSIPSGINSAIKAVRANYRWLDRFEEVIFWMDNDEPGQAVIEELCTMFPGKAKTIKVEGFKDASEILQANKEGDIYGAVWAAVKYSPEGIINAALAGDDMLQPEGEVIAEYPWPLTQEHTLGIREGEVCYHVAGTGIGKTSQLVEIQTRLLRDNIRFGIMRFEDTRRKAQLDLMSVEAGQRLHLEPLPVDQMVSLHAKVFGGGLVELFDPEKANWDFDSIMGYLRYMVLGLGCKVVFIDPLSFVVSGANERDERKALDLIAYEFAKFVKHSKGNLQIAHHLRRADGKAHEEGGEISINEIRGSGGIANYSMSIFGYERNQQGERPDLTRIRILKNRFVGWTGVADVLQWDEQLGRQLVTDEHYPEDGDEKAFGPVSKDY